VDFDSLRLWIDVMVGIITVSGWRALHRSEMFSVTTSTLHIAQLDDFETNGAPY